MITAAEYEELGAVSTTPAPAVNNGVLVVLTEGSIWTVTDTCYLIGLSLDL